MPTKMFFSIPLDAKAPTPSVKAHAREVAKIYEDAEAKKARKANKNPDDDTPGAPDSSDEEDGGGYGGWRGGRGGRGDQSQPPRKLTKFHADSGFLELLAWSGGGGAGRRRRRWNNSHGNDLSLTLWFDKNLPAAMISCLRGEYLPKASLRIFHGAEDGKFKVLEHELESCLVSSCYTGGSGGENKFTANLSITYNKMSSRNFVFDIATGDLVSESTGSFDATAKTGASSGAEVTALTSLCEQFVMNNKKDFDKKDLINLIRSGVVKVAPGDLGIDQSLLSMPRNGRRFRVISAKGTEQQDVYLKTISFEALKTACLLALKVDEADFDFISSADEQGRLVEVYKDDHVEYMPSDTSIYLFVKETEEEKTERLERENQP